MEFISNLYEETKNLLLELAEKFGEKKTAKAKDLLDPIYNFFKLFN